MKYSDMPETAPSQPQMMCTYCHAGPFSATRGDYFMYSDDEVVKCGECEGDMILVRHVEYWEPV